MKWLVVVVEIAVMQRRASYGGILQDGDANGSDAFGSRAESGSGGNGKNAKEGDSTMGASLLTMVMLLEGPVKPAETPKEGMMEPLILSFNIIRST